MDINNQDKYRDLRLKALRAGGATEDEINELSNKYSFKIEPPETTDLELNEAREIMKSLTPEKMLNMYGASEDEKNLEFPNELNPPVVLAQKRFGNVKNIIK
jgi:hypothetical protein